MFDKSSSQTAKVIGLLF